jgi:hypothetical protein
VLRFVIRNIFKYKLLINGGKAVTLGDQSRARHCAVDQ